ncbi:MAG TPA: iron-containing alcohol dehydrogenase [Tepidisphaeraceae bacterium]|jgi:alcohol dehydrogenase|nr:iron-containing alcohol dehydrogenase [Tepidisphaeraceae bacterium]
MLDLPTSSIPLPIEGSGVRVAFGSGNLNHLGDITAAEKGQRVLLVTDPGIRDAGHVERAVRSLYQAGIAVRVFDGVEENPTIVHVGRGFFAARDFKPDLIIGLGGGSSMDCAKGINFLYSNGGRMQDYWGVGKATKPMLPMIAIPTTAGTGSDAQSFALITDPETHQKMACGDKKALPKVALLDPDLTATQPPKVAAATGIDAVAHAVETAATNKRTETSRRLSRESWQLLESGFQRSMRDPKDAKAREQMLLGAHLAGAAIENSMLGAAHALANGLTAVCGTVHGVAVGLMLPQVVRFNSRDGNPYASLNENAELLAQSIERLLDAGHLPRKLAEVGADAGKLDELSAIAAKQWTATFNPRKVGQVELREIYEMAL